MSEVDRLEVKIEASAQQANSQLESLISKLKEVKSALGGINTSSLGGITSSSKSMNSSIGNSSNALRNLSTSLKGFSSSGDKASNSAKSLAYYFGKMYANFFLVKRGAESLGKSILSSMDYIEQYNYFNVTIGKVADEWSKDYSKYGYDNAQSYGNSFQDRLSAMMTKMTGFQMNKNGTLTDTKMQNLGIDITDLTNYSAGLMQVTNSLGLTGEASVSTAKAMTMLAGDMSSFRNLDLKTVMTNFQSGLIGQSRALYKYGIDITNATLQQYAYANGINKSITDMTQGEKMQLRMIAILDQSKVAYGDLANTINSPANQLRMLKNEFAALSRTMGNLFLPMVAKVLPYINGLVIAIRRLFEWVGSLLGVDLSGIIGQSSAGYSDAFADVADSADDASSAIDGATDAAKKYQNEALSFDEINKLTDNSSSSSGSSGKGSGSAIDLTDALNKSLADYESVWNTAFSKMDNKANQYADDIQGFFQGIAKYAQPSVEAVKNLWNDGLSKFADFNYNNAVNFLDDFLIPVGKWTLGKGIPELVDATNDFLDKIDWSMLLKNLDKFYKVLEPFAEGVGQGLVDFYKGVTSVGAEVINVVGLAIGGFSEAILKTGGASNMRDIGEGLGKLLGSIIMFKTAASVVDIVAKIGTSFVGEKGLISLLIKHPATAAVIGLTSLLIAINGFTDGVDSGALKITAAAISGLVISIGTFKTISTASAMATTLAESLAQFTLLSINPVTMGIAGAAGLTAALIALFALSKNAQGDSTLISDSVKKVTQSTQDYVTSVNSKKVDVESTYAGVKSIADKYFALAGNFDNLTGSQKELVKTYAQYIVDKCPELGSSIDTTTGQFKGQKEEVYMTIDALGAYAKAAAMEDVLKKGYAQQYDLEKQLKDNTTQYNAAEKAIYKYAYQLTGLSENSFNATYDIKGLGDAYDVVTDMLNDSRFGYAINKNKLSLSKFSKEVGLNSKETWELSNNNRVLKRDLDDCNNSINDASETAAQAIAKYNELTGAQNGTGKASDGLTKTTVANNALIAASAQVTSTLVSQSTKNSTDSSMSSINDFYNSTNATFGKFLTVGVNGGSGLRDGFMSTSSVLPSYSNSLFSQIHDLTSLLAASSGNDSGATFVDRYRSQVGDGIPNTTAVAFLSIMDRVNLGSITAQKGAELMSGLADSMNSNAWRVHDALTNAIESSYKFEVTGENYSTGDPMTTGFMTLRPKAYALGGFPEKGQYFLARERGPELVGTIGGKSAVANNDQITSSIANAVYPAVYNAIKAATSSSNGHVTVNVNLVGDTGKMFKAIQSEAQNYTTATGNAAFPF